MPWRTGLWTPSYQRDILTTSSPTADPARVLPQQWPREPHRQEGFRPFPYCHCGECGAIPRSEYSKMIRFNTQLLRDGETEQYRTALRALIRRWSAWRRRLLSAGSISRGLISLLWAGLMFCLHEGAHSTLGHTITWDSRNVMRQQSLSPAGESCGGT